MHHYGRIMLAIDDRVGDNGGVVLVDHVNDNTS